MLRTEVQIPVSVTGFKTNLTRGEGSMIQKFGRKVLVASCILGIGILVGCGGQEEEAAVKTEAPVKAEAPAESHAAPVNNPLAKEQALLRDAAAVQGILDKNADRKKKTLEDAMN